MSPTIRASGVGKVEALDNFDRAMSDVLNAVSARSRASKVQKKLATFVNGAMEYIIVPLIQHEGSPRQVAARQVVDAVGGTLTEEEAAYVEEAARCVTVQAHRAAIIMLWAAAVARVHAAVSRIGFDEYNKAVDAFAGRKGQPFSRINSGSKLSSLPELQRARDADLLVVGMELFKYDLQVFQELDRLLGIRNDSAHPGMATPSTLDVQQFAGKLQTHVFERIH
jgi:hypothetical protein